MYISASSQCFSDLPFLEACEALVDLEYDRIEIWLSEKSNHLRPSEVAAAPERFLTLFRENTRLTPIAMHLQEDVATEAFEGLCRLCKLLKITQITLPAAELGTPFNEEIDRLRSRLAIANQNGIRLSLKTKGGHLTEDPQTAVELCQAVPGLGLTLDISYFVCGKFANQKHDVVYPHVCHVHLRDTSATQLQVPVGLGEVDYGRIISQLSRCSYQWALSVEILPELLGESERSLELRKIRMLLETLL